MKLVYTSRPPPPPQKKNPKTHIHKTHTITKKKTKSKTFTTSAKVMTPFRTKRVLWYVTVFGHMHLITMPILGRIIIILT